MKKAVLSIGIILAIAGLGAAAHYWQYLEEAGAAVLPPPRDIAKAMEPGNPAGAAKPLTPPPSP